MSDPALTTYIIYDTTGAVRQSGQCSVSQFGFLQQAVSDGRWPGVPDAQIMRLAELPTDAGLLGARGYVDAGLLRSRVAIEAIVSTYNIVANGVDEASITGLPIPCTVTIEGALSMIPFELDDGTLIITSDAAGDIFVSIAAPPPWLPWTTTIHAT